VHDESSNRLDARVEQGIRLVVENWCGGTDDRRSGLVVEACSAGSITEVLTVAVVWFVFQRKGGRRWEQSVTVVRSVKLSRSAPVALHCRWSICRSPRKSSRFHASVSRRRSQW